MSSFTDLAGRLESDRKVWLVTGSAGFIGSHLVAELLRLGQRVVGLDNFAAGSRRNLAEVRELTGARRWKNFRQLTGDIRNPKACRSACRGVDYVLHQAALGSAPKSIACPAEFHDTNVTGFLNMLLAARDGGVGRLVYASSSAVYGDHPDLPKVEDKIGNCLSPYAVTKRANELYADIFARSYGMQSIGLRYFNVLGARQNPEGDYAAVIPKWIAAMVGRRPVRIYGDGETTRDFCPVANVVQANLLAATAGRADSINQVYNIGARTRTSLNRLFEKLRKSLLPRHPHLKGIQPVYEEFRPGDVRHSEADISKATRLLGYEPTRTLDEGLVETVEWHYSHSSSRILRERRAVASRRR